MLLGACDPACLVLPHPCMLGTPPVPVCISRHQGGAAVTDVALSGTTYTSAAYTYMKPHGVPSAGDWALDRWGAIFLQGTESAKIEGCT